MLTNLIANRPVRQTLREAHGCGEPAPSRFARHCAGRALRDGVETVPAQRTALRQANEGQGEAPDGAVRPDGFSGVVSARRMKPAGAGKERGKQQLIDPEQAEQAAGGERSRWNLDHGPTSVPF